MAFASPGADGPGGPREVRMGRCWQLGLGLVVALVFGGVYPRTPARAYFSVPRDVRSDRDAFEGAVPSWAPKKRINLGLDLQGGVHLVLGVDLDKAIKDKV